ncbi:endonuclease III [Enterococcus florum]|uniref:Endonuclease III n=1 Tax=Enterococcus florum TaxID=2480627 RepID=A0A4P5PH35_9ENTE|nr:deoxyribonuclease I [Enterococcus florum]GCF95638.1 endonuclease III [Enterococcus florum]
MKKRIVNLEELYTKMEQQMSERRWWDTDDPWEIMIGAILVQNTNWKNVDYSLVNLKEATDFEPRFMLGLDLADLQRLIRPSGFYKNKSQTIQALLQWTETYGFDLERIKQKKQEILREELLAIKGVGFETADVLLVFIFEKIAFIADRYAQRLFQRLGVEQVLNYQKLQSIILLPESFTTSQAQKLHGWIVEYGQLYLRNEVTWANGFLKDFQLKWTVEK